MAAAAAMAAPAVAVAGAGADGKEAQAFRNYVDSSLQARVERTYLTNHTLQTLGCARALLAELRGAATPRAALTLHEALALLDLVVDESDPDLDDAQSLHAFQTAEALRAQFPDRPWLHLVGLIHDAGKVLALPQFNAFPQSFVVGDTFPLGCRFAQEIVFSRFFEHNPDSSDPALSSQCGIYAPGCGLDKVVMSFGHDEYLYHVLKSTPTCTLPAEGLYIVRFHSFYAHHQFEAYAHLLSDFDREMLPVLRTFQKCDLYSKSPNMPPIADLKAYYSGLMRQYGLDGALDFPVLQAPACEPAATAAFVRALASLGQPAA